MRWLADHVSGSRRGPRCLIVPPRSCRPGSRPRDRARATRRVSGIRAATPLALPVDGIVGPHGRHGRQARGAGGRSQRRRRYGWAAASETGTTRSAAMAGVQALGIVTGVAACSSPKPDLPEPGRAAPPRATLSPVIGPMSTSTEPSAIFSPSRADARAVDVPSPDFDGDTVFACRPAPGRHEGRGLPAWASWRRGCSPSRSSAALTSPSSPECRVSSGDQAPTSPVVPPTAGSLLVIL